MLYFIENVLDFDSATRLLFLIYIPNDLISFKLILCAIFVILFFFLASLRSISLVFCIICYTQTLQKKEKADTFLL